MKGPETRLRNNIMKALREKYPQGFFKHIHGNPYQDAGIPDIIGSVSGIFIGLEVKLPGGRGATLIQLATLANINDSGGYAGVVTSIEEAFEITEEAIINLRSLQSHRSAN